MPNSKPRSWIRDHFLDHPRYVVNAANKVRPDEVWTHPGSGKIKVACCKCLEYEVGYIRNIEDMKASEDPTFIPRTVQEIQLAIFNGPPDIAGSQPPRRAWFEARTDTLLHHIRACIHQTQELRDLAAEKSAVATAALRTRRQGALIASMPPTPAISSPLLLSSLTPLYPPTHHMSLPPTPILTSNNPWDSGSMPGFPVFPAHAPLPQTLSPLILPSGGSIANSNPTSRSASPAIGPHTAPDSLPPFPRPRNYTSHPNKRTASSNIALAEEASWSPNRQQAFEERLARLTASAGFSLSWVENPEWIAFCQDFLPSAKLFSRKSLAERILPSTLRTIRDDAKTKTRGQKVTLQCDGWTGVNNHHFQAFMMTTEDRKLYTVDVSDVSASRKTAANLLSLMKEIINTVQKDWGAIVIAFTTDASGESRRARLDLRLEFPFLVTPDCWAHQINLVVGDYFKITVVAFLRYAARANELITWLRSKTTVLALIRQAAEKYNHHSYSVIRPVATRWTAYYLAYERLLDLKKLLELVISEDNVREAKDKILIPASADQQARQKARRMIRLIQTPAFWKGLTRIKVHLAPLAVAANITQSAFCRLDEVLLTFGSLFIDFNALKDREEEKIRTGVIASLEKRWGNCDKEVYLAAVILNPFIKLTPFQRRSDIFSLASIAELLSRLWMRFFATQNAPPDLYEDVRSYLENTGPYKSLPKTCTHLRGQAEINKRSPDPLQAYNDISIPDPNHEYPVPPVIALARHILSIGANSASCERLFSTFGLILTKLRSRLGNQKLRDLAELKLHIRDEHIRNNLAGPLRNRTREFRAAALRDAQFAAGPIRGIAISDPNAEDVPMVDPTNIDRPDLLAVSAPVSSSELQSDLDDANSDDSDSELGDEEGFDPEFDEDLLDGEAAKASSRRSLVTRSLRRMTRDLQSAVEEDEEDTGSQDSQPSQTFDDEHWTVLMGELKLSSFISAEGMRLIGYAFLSAKGSLADELEYYQLIEPDSDREPDVDEAAEAVIMPQ